MGRRNALATATVTVTVTTGLGGDPTGPTRTGGATTATPVNGRLAVPTTGLLALDCPGLSSSQTITLDGKNYNFSPKCGVDINGANVDIIAIAAYTSTHCLLACASYNRNSGNNTCVGVEFNANMANIVANAGTCWLKKFTNVQALDSNTTNRDLHVGWFLS